MERASEAVEKDEIAAQNENYNTESSDKDVKNGPGGSAVRKAGQQSEKNRVKENVVTDLPSHLRLSGQFPDLQGYFLHCKTRSDHWHHGSGGVRKIYTGKEFSLRISV